VLISRKIIATVDEARQAATKAAAAAIKAFERASPPSGNLKMKADQVSSKDSTFVELKNTLNIFAYEMWTFFPNVPPYLF